MPLEQVTANISGKVRRETLHGRSYLVAPLSLIVPGVLNGSKGPLFYSEEDTAAGADAWNGIPIVVDHPTHNGTPVSARSPQVLEKAQIGTVFQTTMNGKLIAEGWFDEELTKKVDSRVSSALNNGAEMELSTGLYTTDEPAQSGAVHNGKPYTAIARNHRPDHLAVLPDSIGACSVNDGCGLNVNSEVSDSFLSKMSTLFEKFFSKTPSNQKQETPEGKKMAKLTDNEKKTLVDGIILNCDCWKEEDRETLNGMDDRALQGLDKGSKSEKTLTEQTAVVNAVKKGFQVGNDNWTLNEKGEWVKKDSPKDPAKPDPTTNRTGQLSAEDWFDAAPPEVQSAVRNAVTAERLEKDRIIQSMVAGISDEAARNQQAERLGKRTLDDLREDARLVAPLAANNNPFSPGYTPDHGYGPQGAGYPAPNYSGAAVPHIAHNTGEGVEKEDLLLPPTVNYQEEAEARKQKSA